MANRIVAERHIVAVSNHSLIPLIHRQRDKVISLALQSCRRRNWHSRHHPLKISIGNGNFPGYGIANAIRGLRDRSLTNNVGRQTRDHRRSMGHSNIVAQHSTSFGRTKLANSASKPCLIEWLRLKETSFERRYNELDVSAFTSAPTRADSFPHFAHHR